MYYCELITRVFMHAIHAVCEQLAQDLTRISQLATNRAEEKLKVKMGLDKAKIEFLEAELAKMHIVVKKSEEKLVSTKTALATAKFLRQKLGKTLASIEHQFFKMHQFFQEAERI